MKTWKKILAVILAGAMALAMASCGSPKKTNATISIGVPFNYDSVDPHRDFQGWYTSIYGVTESLFRMGDNGTLEPCLAKSASLSDNVWTVKLCRNARFSNGNPVTSDMVARNLKRAGQENPQYAVFTQLRYDTSKKHTLRIITKDGIPTLKNTLSSPCLGIIDLDASKDPDKAIVGTGPFILKNFDPEGIVSVLRNENYWDGTVSLAGARFITEKQDAPKLFGMQNGYLDAVTNVTSDAYPSYQENADKYKAHSVEGSRLLFFYLNQKTLDKTVRTVINGYLDKKFVEKFSNGMLTATNGPFNENVSYGKVKAPRNLSAEECRELLKKDGYTAGEDGILEKDGKSLRLRVETYGMYNLDAFAKLMQKQLKQIGIACDIQTEKDPDSTYMKDGDFDIAFYSLIPDKENDPYEFLEKMMGPNGKRNVCGYGSKETNALLAQLRTEPRPEKRAKLARELVQKAIDSGCFGYIGLVNKVTVLRNGISGLSETSPYDFYCLTARTTLQ